ncbi:E3 SUMO-protein ligase PIAS2 isoform X4 [Eupeodes corollae]|uniref:E3 SUMO-protein ligase PIAS2 isoform X4 n=1 Tax=Eupeodes corollae TaxID=290404 RepID=UPI0024903989|nr:E3 SUMO-protein ligase PIAS2 isoform X4 [Eupeodes corollae]
MRKTRSQTQAENGPSASTRSTRAAASSTKTTTSSSSSSTSSARERDQDKNENPFAAAAAAASPNPPLTNNQANRQTIELDPAKLKEYQDMIQTFRVVDLHKVLQFLSLSVAGRKHELQQRVLDLLKTNFELVSTKLREIYRTDYYSDRNVQYGPPDPKRMFSHMQMPTVQSTADVRSAMVSVGNVGNAGVGQNPGNGAGAVPANMGVPFQHNIGASMPIHPDVRLKKLAFYDVLATLIKPSSLLPRSNQRIQELPFYFTLTPQQATEIATNRDIRNGSKVEHSIQVQLRFCLLETSCEQEDCFPSNVIVKVNNKLCPLPNPIPTNRPNVEPKRPPRPVNVTSNVKLSPTVTNTITVQWCPDFSRGYCIAAYLVKKLTSSQLLHRMKTKGIKPADYTRGLIKEKLTEDADCEIATTMLKVSLNCPLGKMKMSIPCRASTCSHLQCFDANLYLQMNERKPTWNCPVCDKPAIYDHLVIDGYFQEVLASSLLGSEDTEIQLHKDGSWSTHNLRNETQLIDTPSKPVEKVELISDDIELITDDVKPLTKVPPPPVISNEPTSTTNSETVDLTLSDSDDDMPLAKRKTSAAKNATTSSAVSTSNGQRSATVQSSQSSKGETSIISLDSPSPPSSPIQTSDENTGVSSTTSTKSSSDLQMIISSSDSGGPGMLLNPLALNSKSKRMKLHRNQK